MSLIDDILYNNELALARIDELEREIRDIEAARQVFSSRTLEQMPGKKHNYEVPIDLVVPANSTARINDTFTHNESGMFVVEYLYAAYREDGQARWRPASSLWDNNVAPATVNSLDFLWEITEDQGYNWQSNPLSSALLSGIEKPFYLPVPAQITGSQLIRVQITPTRAPVAAGMLAFVFGGYIIQDPPPNS